MSEDATTVVVLTAILKKHNAALKKVGDDPRLIAEVNKYTVWAIQDNAHNIKPRQTNE